MQNQMTMGAIEFGPAPQYSAFERIRGVGFGLLMNPFFYFVLAVAVGWLIMRRMRKK